MQTNPPALNELEVSVFGRGYGEAICAHVGDGQWVAVDSCINPETGEPAAISYLASLGVSLSDAVRLVVITHWDDDHVRGVGEIVRASLRARVACSAALCRKEIFAFILGQEGARGTLGSGLDELRSVLRLCAERGVTITWAKANVPLYPLPPGDAPTVVALSPSEDAFERALRSLIEAATGAKSTLPRRYRAPEGPNGASVATWVRRGDIGVLLGADLEVSANSETGWEGVLKYSRQSSRASLIKVPHHGSKGAHHEGVWQDLAGADPVAVLTPWSRGKGYLPTMSDLERLRALSSRLFLTAMPSLVRARKAPEVEKMIRRLHGEKVSHLRGWGQVRARRYCDEGQWRVELGGDAVAVSP